MVQKRVLTSCSESSWFVGITVLAVSSDGDFTFGGVVRNADCGRTQIDFPLSFSFDLPLLGE